MGSAYGWLDDQDVHCYNVIPMEITEQICESIIAGKRFELKRNEIGNEKLSVSPMNLSSQHDSLL